jgi:hypothetical protein
VGSTMVLNSVVDIEGLHLLPVALSMIATTRTDLDSMLFQFVKRFLGSAHRYDTRNRGITTFVQSRLHIVSSLTSTSQ